MTAAGDLRKKLIATIEAATPARQGRLTEDMSLIKSGLLDSLGLFNLAAMIEREVGAKLDLASFDLATEWDTVTSMLRFIERSKARAWPPTAK
jgi:acyl carrier protein